MAKVDEQYNHLKGIIDEQKEGAKNIIRNLESVQNYRPPPQNFTIETLEDLNTFSSQVDQMMQSMKQNLGSSKFLEILKQKKAVEDYQNQLNFVELVLRIEVSEAIYHCKKKLVD